MADVTLSYKGSDILELSDSGSATLKTGGKYCEDDIAVEYVKPSGGGDDSNGLVDLVFDYTNGTQSWSGVVEDNTVKNYSLSGFCSPPLLLKKPIVVAKNDHISITVTSSASFYADVGFMYPFIHLAGRNVGTYPMVDNVLLDGTKTFEYTYSGNGTVFDRMIFYPRSAPVSNIQSTQLSLSINDVLIF